MLLAWLGTGLLVVVVVVTSLVVVRRRLAHEVWHAIHLLSYVAVLVAIPHQLSAGQVLSGSTPQTFYWICLYVLAFGSIAWFRFAAPLLATDEHQLRVTAVEPLSPGVFSIHLSGRDLSRLGVRGGQYAIWRFWSRRTWWHAHPISFSAVPTDTEARLTVRALGAGTERLARLKAGTKVSFAGPTEYSRMPHAPPRASPSVAAGSASRPRGRCSRTPTWHGARRPSSCVPPIDRRSSCGTRRSGWWSRAAARSSR